MRIEKRNITELAPAAYNPRVDLQPGDDEYEKLKRSIETWGLVEPIVLNERTGNVVGGHQRLKVLQDIGYKEIDVSVVDLHENDEKALNVALNKIEGNWDNAKLKDLLEELDNGAYDLELTGFDMDEIESLMTQYFDEEEIQEDEFEINDAIESAKKETRTATGDIWQLGNHKLIVGDATNENDVLALVGEEEVDMIFTDPPYNVDYEGKTEDSLKIQNDKFDSDGEFYQFLLDAHENMFKVTKPGGALYVCHADSEGLNFRKAYAESGFLLKQCLIWVKNSMVLGRQDYHWKHEPILYGWKPGASHNWYNDRKRTTIQEFPVDLSIEPQKDHTILTFNSGISTIAVKVKDYEVLHDGTDEQTTTWRIERPNRNADHPTMKPIKLCSRAILSSSKTGDIVLDPFGGSGSTLIACEQTGRSCRTIEFDPIYADIIIKRWEDLTGRSAVKIT